MSKPILTKGKATNAASATTKVLRYLPRQRSPWQPSRFRRENMDPADLQAFWDKGRRRDGASHPMSGYATGKTLKRDEDSVSLIPKHELEKFMPNIHIGPAAAVTPVSLMSARSGHRVTHDLLHSYDRHIGRLGADEAVVDHDNITPHDTNRVGLHADTISCRARIYRWMRRGPFFNEDNYFRRSATPGGQHVVADAERPLCAKIIRLAKHGHVKSACEEYRRLAFVPTVDVYRALTAACVPDALLADAIAIFQDGERLLYVARDAVVFRNLMAVAIAAGHRERVMWVHTLVAGTFSENVHVRTKIEPLRSYEINADALEFLLDGGMAEEGRAVYRYLADGGMLGYDLAIKLGQQLREQMKKGGVAQLAGGAALPVAVGAAEVAGAVAKAYLARMPAHEAALHAAGAAPSLALLEALFADVDVPFVLRHARFSGAADLMATDVARFVDRALAWLDLLSDRKRRVARPLPYLLKSKPSSVNPNVRVAAVPAAQQRRRLLPSEDGFAFAYAPGMRFVQETFPSVNAESNESKYLVRHAVHREVAAAIKNFAVPLPMEAPPLAVLHPLVAQAAGGGAPAVAAAPAAAVPEVAAGGGASAAPAVAKPDVGDKSMPNAMFD
jgi:hypothetical protein